MDNMLPLGYPDPNHEHNHENHHHQEPEQQPKLTFSLQGGAAFSLIVYVLYNVGLTQGVIPQASVPTEPRSGDKMHLEMFIEMKQKVDTIYTRTESMQHEVEDLWEWHSIKDENGRLIWYSPQSITKVTDSNQKILDEIQKTNNEIRGFREDLRRSNR